MNRIIILLFMFIANEVTADTIPYTQETVKSYLMRSELVALVYKVDGYMSFHQYYELLSKVSSESEESVYKKWKENKRFVDDTFLVLKNFDKEDNYGFFIDSVVLGASKEVTEIGKTYLIFFRKNPITSDLKLSYSICDIVQSNKVSNLVLHNIEKNTIIDTVIDKRLLGCYIVE